MGWVLFFLSAFLCTKRSSFRISSAAPSPGVGSGTLGSFCLSFLFFFFSKGGGGRSESTFLVNSTPERQPCQGRCRPPGSDPLRCLSQALAHQVLPSSARPGSPTLCSVPGCLLTSPFSLASGIECPLPPPFNPSDAPHPHPDFMGRGAGLWEQGSRD